MEEPFFLLEPWPKYGSVAAFSDLRVHQPDPIERIILTFPSWEKTFHLWSSRFGNYE
jgi:hypothetical protein